MIGLMLILLELLFMLFVSIAVGMALLGLRALVHKLLLDLLVLTDTFWGQSGFKGFVPLVTPGEVRFNRLSWLFGLFGGILSSYLEVLGLLIAWGMSSCIYV